MGVEEIKASRLGSFPPLFGLPEFLRLFPRKLSQRPLSAPRGQRSVLEVAWDDVTSARALGRLPGRRPPPLFIPQPPTSAPSPVPTPCHLFPLTLPLALAACRWETLAWSSVRGRGTGVVGPKDFAPWLGYGNPGALCPRLVPRAFLPSPSSP